MAREVVEQQGGFTLVEVMVVVLVIGTLLAIGIPTFLGTRQRAEDAQARTNLDVATDAAFVVSDAGTDFETATSTALATAEPSLGFVGALVESSGPTEVSVNPASSGTWVAAVQSDSGSCFGVVLRADGREFFDSDSCVAGRVTDEFSGPASYDLVRTAPVISPADTCMTLEGDGRFYMRACDGSDAQSISVYTDAITGLSQLRINGQCIGLENDSSSNGDRITPEVCDADDLHQTFIRDDVNQHWESAVSENPAMCLDARTQATVGVDVYMWTCSDSNRNQVWPI